MSEKILIGAAIAEQEDMQDKSMREHVFLYPSMANRHGLIAGATGTGKTVTLQVLAESFSRIGVPVFTADVKGDLSGLAAAAKAHPKVDERIEKIGIDHYTAQASPVRFWDIYAKAGHVVRTTVEDMGPDLLSNLLQLSDAQASILYAAFTYADDKKLPLLNLDDLRTLILYIQENRQDIESEYGAMSTQSLGALQRKLLVLEEQGGDHFFGEPALNIEDFMQLDNGRGVINILDGRDLILKPRIYTTFLLWFLSELFERLEEQGDADKPRLVFFFDEAHLLFDHAPKALLERVEQVVRIIRSKGVGIYFVTQSPGDVPDDVLGQLGNRVQHALRAFTPKEQKTINVAAQSFRQNPELDTKKVITQMGVGEALVSVLDEKGVPTIVEHVLIAPPQSQIGAVDDSVRLHLLESSALQKHYGQLLDRESAHEILMQKRELKEEKVKDMTREEKSITSKTRTPRGGRDTYFESFGKSLLRSMASGLGRRVINALVKNIGRR